MKRVLCLLLTLLTFAASASADSLKVTLGVPNRVDLSFKTNTGVTTINIHAAVEMPDVDSVSVYDYAPVRLPEEQALAMARALGLEEIKEVRYEWLSKENFGTIYSDFEREEYVAGTPDDYIFHVCNDLWHGKPFGGQVYYNVYGTPIEYRMRFDIHPYGELPENGQLTREEARRMAFDLAAKVVADYTLTQEGLIEGMQYPRGETQEEVIANWDENLFIPTGYKFVFGRVVDGIPMTVANPLRNYASWDPYGDFVGGEYMPDLDAESLTMVIADGGFQEIKLTNPFAVGEAIEENLTDLLPFDRVLEIVQSVLPLKMLAFEDTKYQTENRVEIERITFGYMRVLKPDAPREYILVPVWDFFGNKLNNRRNYDGSYETYMTNELATSYLTIDARTGLVIDREYGY